jgi:hypothetical protein
MAFRSLSMDSSCYCNVCIYLQAAGETVRSVARRTHFDKILQLFKDCPSVAQQIYHRHFVLNNLEKHDPEMEELKAAVLEIARGEWYWGEQLPTRWIPLERSLSDMAQHTPIATLEEVVQADQANEVPIADLEQIDLFLQYHSAQGTVVYFPDLNLRHTVILDSQWIVDAFRSIITTNRFHSSPEQNPDMWRELEEKAVLRDEVIDVAWQQEPERHFAEHREILLQFMEKLDILSRPRVLQDDNSLATLDFYLVPSCLRRVYSTEFVLDHEYSKATPTLSFVFEGQLLPQAVFYRLLAACMGRWAVAGSDTNIHLYCGAGVFQLDHVHQMHIFLKRHVIDACVYTKADPGDVVLSDRVRRFLTATIKRERNRHQQNLPFRLYVGHQGNQTAVDEIMLSDDCTVLKSWYPDEVTMTFDEHCLLTYFSSLN